MRVRNAVPISRSDQGVLERRPRLPLSSLAWHPSPVSTTWPRVTWVPVTAVLLVEIFFEIMQKKFGCYSVCPKLVLQEIKLLQFS